MTGALRYVVNGLLEYTGALRRRWEHLTQEHTTVLAVTRNPVCKMSLRVVALEQGWRILFAESIEDALRLQILNRICVLVYDRDLPGVEWRAALRCLLGSSAPLFPIVLSGALQARLRSEVLRCGGYDVARKPLEPRCFVALVRGALALAASIDALETRPTAML